MNVDHTNIPRFIEEPRCTCNRPEEWSHKVLLKAYVDLRKKHSRLLNDLLGRYRKAAAEGETAVFDLLREVAAGVMDDA